MLAFPQVLTCGSGLYPVRKRHISRTVFNRLADGSAVAWSDVDAGAVVWDISLAGLTRSETDAIEALFESSQGDQGTFTMLDPLGNLLSWSEDFTAAAWVKDPLIQIQPGVVDPWGGTRGTRCTNGSNVVAGVKQALTVPSGFHYCLSVWAGAQSSGSISLGIGDNSVRYAIGAGWNRIQIAGVSNETLNAVSFQIQIPPGSSVDLCAAQVEPQLAPSNYKRTGAFGGIYPHARFASQELIAIAQSVDVFDAAVRVFSREH
jgi:hypothetical protein